MEHDYITESCGACKGTGRRPYGPCAGCEGRGYLLIPMSNYIPQTNEDILEATREMRAAFNAWGFQETQPRESFGRLGPDFVPTAEARKFLKDCGISSEGIFKENA